MKAKTMAVMTALLMGSGTVLAAGGGADHEAHHPNSAGNTTQGSNTMHDGGMPMMQTDKHMQKMRAQMDEIRRTDDPVKRDKLIQAHMAEMQGMMKMMEMMKGMHGGKAMMGQDGMMGNQQAATEKTRKRHDHQKTK